MFAFPYSKKFVIPVLLVQSFFSLWAVCRTCGLSSRSILTPILFITFFLYFKYISQLEEKRKEIYTRHTTAVALAVSFFFTLLFLLAESLSLTAGLDHRLFKLVILAVCSIGFFFLIFHSFSLLLILLVPYTLTENPKQVKHIPLFCFFACLLGWLPYFLYEYPAIMTPDSVNQLEQVLAMIPYNNHHPWAHTMVLKALYSFGFFLTGNQNAALAFFTLFQMCFLSACVSWLIATLLKLGVKNNICYFITAFYALVPYHAVFAVTVWKDVMFSGSVLLFTTALARLFFFHSGQLSSRIIYILSGIMICLFRTNGWYAFLFSLPFLLYAFRRHLIQMLPLHLVILFIALVVKIPVMNAFHVVQPDFVESICIPLQQTARVICEDKELTEEEWESIHKVIDTTYIKELYAPGFADNMKELVRAGDPGYLTEHKGEYLKLWYPDVAYTVGDIDGIIANETGVTSHPLIGGPFIVKTKEILQKLGDMLPLYGLLFSMGAMFWTLTGCIAVVFAKKQYQRFILFLPGLAVILTLHIRCPFICCFHLLEALKDKGILPIILWTKSPEAFGSLDG